jgi:hypothetical protein
MNIRDTNRLLICSDCGFRAKLDGWLIAFKLQSGDIISVTCPSCKQMSKEPVDASRKPTLN